MGAIAYALGVASTVVANVLTELITGRAKRARQEEIERHVALALSRERADNAVLRNELARVMAEVSLLVTRHPHLSTKGTDVVLSDTRLPKVLFPSARRNALLIAELKTLDDIVAARRRELAPEQELGVAQPPEVGAKPTESASEDEDATPDAPAAERGGRWANELARMGDQIRRRREE